MNKYPIEWECIELKRQSEALKQYFVMFLLASIFILCVVSSCLADDIAILTVAYEASGEPYAGQVAVAGVIKQRAKERRLSFDEVCLQRHQFSCWKDGKPTQKRKLTTREIDKGQKAWDEAIAEGYNHYHHKSILPYWAKGKIGVLIGSHLFYKL